ncbi:MAG: hypothetical protein OHK0012_08540 [Synechococcales cyanobacterium]
MIGQTLDEYQVDCLYLLVGENSLPNYIAAIKLAKENSKVILVHTNQTQIQAQCLKKALSVNHNFEISNIHLSSGQDSQEVYDKLAANVQRQAGEVGLHYTGGTKIMAVHSYRAITDYAPKAIFSYLDPYRSEFCIENHKACPSKIHIQPNLSLQDMIQLHGLAFQLGKPPSQDPMIPGLNQKLASLLIMEMSYENWCKWLNSSLQAIYEIANNPHKELRKEVCGLINIDVLLSSFQSCLSDYFIVRDNFIDVWESANRYNLLPRDVIKWLYGIWLEDYVLESVKAIAERCELHDYGRTLQIQRTVLPSWDPYPQFEVDIAFVKGYQLFVISCTTSYKKAICKQKLLEVYQRARQLGGSEARIGLVCRHNRPGIIQQELELLGKNEKIRVFGTPDWEKLPDNLANWIIDSH